MESRKDSGIGFLVSLVIHVIILATIWFAVTNKTNDSANGIDTEVIDTNISMEMIMAMRVAEPEPAPEPEPEPEAPPEELQKEIVADPTVKPEPEKPKEPEKKEPKPKEKRKEKHKKKPKEITKEPLVAKVRPTATQDPKAQLGDREVVGNSDVNSRAAGAGRANSDNTNLTGAGSNTSEIAAYQSKLRREIERHKRYSQRAKMMKKQGIVKIAFNVNPDGSLSNARVAQSSGHDELDNSALQAVSAANSVGPKPAGMPTGISVPIQFTLR